MKKGQGKKINKGVFKKMYCIDAVFLKFKDIVLK
jgi:hypothetical protein